MPLRQQDILSGKDTKLLRVELNKQNKEKAHLHHFSPSNDIGVLILLIIFYAWLKPLPNTSVVLSIEIKALRFSLWINACSCNASRWVRVV